VVAVSLKKKKKRKKTKKKRKEKKKKRKKREEKEKRNDLGGSSLFSVQISHFRIGLVSNELAVFDDSSLRQFADRSRGDIENLS